MSDELSKTKQAYAELILRCGVNLQPGESVVIRAELGHREFVRLLVATAYDLGARFVAVDLSDPLSTRARYQHVERQYLGYVPDYEVTRRRQTPRREMEAGLTHRQTSILKPTRTSTRRC